MRPKNLLSKAPKVLTVGTLEDALLRAFPADTAEAWDKTGLVVGERAQLVTRVAVALDATPAAVAAAAAIGANVLVTHHPPFIKAPGQFSPEVSPALSEGAIVWAAIKNQVALMCFHTACDVSISAQVTLPTMLGFDYSGKLVCPLEGKRGLGYGQFCDVPARADGTPQTLSLIAARVMATFGRAPRVWGDPDAEIAHAVCATGSAPNVGAAALKSGAQVLIAGEVHYHDALDLAGAGMSIIELGHDVSELPLCAVLAEAVAAAGVQKDAIKLLDQSNNWWTPEAIRL